MFEQNRLRCGVRRLISQDYIKKPENIPIPKKRGAPNGHKGANIADGWRAYSWIDKLQRCWAHLLREVDNFIDASENGKRLSEDIHACFKKFILTSRNWRNP
ncbi:MAG: hypothetical protein EPN24_06365 [Candidatus Methanoperedens sp.]|nr:MAG: hypothetical protein EPN24_06365 [Candidatus Methanoperedens sp.]